MITVAFLDEGTLGHTSYLPRFAAELRRRPELGIKPISLAALPLTGSLARWGNAYLPWFRKHGLDFGASRWRWAASRNLQLQTETLIEQEKVGAVIVNTQSVGLTLPCIAGLPPLFVCLDATFRELESSPWFGPTPLARAAQPLTMSWLRKAERRLFRHAYRLLPWSAHTAHSLSADYGIPAGKTTPLPPSMTRPPQRAEGLGNQGIPQILFLGGNFRRKGGPLLLAVHQKYFADRCELHIVTQNEKPEGKNVFVHHGVQAGSAQWLQRWHEASLFVFPSELETFGIVLIEALAFKVPVISSSAGAAREILDAGNGGLVLNSLEEGPLARAINAVLEHPSQAYERAKRGTQLFEEHFDLGRNTERLAAWFAEAARPT